MQSCRIRKDSSNVTVSGSTTKSKERANRRCCSAGLGHRSFPLLESADSLPQSALPLHNHFEQNFHVRHRLENYRAGRCMDFATSTSESIARAITRDLDRRVSYRAVETDGARRAAQIIAEVL